MTSDAARSLKEQLKEEAKIDVKEDLKNLLQAFLKNRGSGEAKFNYAVCLTKSKAQEDIRRGAVLLNELVAEGFNQREALYYLAVAQYKVAEHQDALQSVNTLLAYDPRSGQAAALKELIQDSITTDGYIGLAIMGGVALVGGIAAGVISKLLSGSGKGHR